MKILNLLKVEFNNILLANLGKYLKNVESFTRKLNKRNKCKYKIVF